MFAVKKDESTAARRRVPVYLVDATDGYTEEVGVTSPTVTVSKNGGTDNAGSGTFAETAAGTYYYEYAAGEIDTLGWTRLRVHKSGVSRPYNAVVFITGYDPYDTIRLGLTALPAAAAEAAGGLFTRGTGAGQINQEDNGYISVNLKAILRTVLTETSGGLIAAAFKKFFDKASPTGTINSIPDAVAGAASGLALVGSNVGAATSVTGAVGSVTGNVGGDVVGNVQGSVASVTDRTGFSLSAAGVKALWDQLLSATFTSGSIGEKIKAFLAALGSDDRPKVSADAHTAGAAVASVTGNVGGNVAGSVASVTDRTGFSLSAAGVKALWDQLLSATFTSGSIGEKIKAFFAALGSDDRPKISADAHTAGAAVASVTGAVGSVTGNVGGNLSGSVGSVAGAVGSVSGDVGGKVLGGGAGVITGAGVRADQVTGSVGSVSGSVGSVVGNVGGDVAGKVLGGGASSLTGDGVRAASVTGAVGSVTGNVGGNVAGSVGSLATQAKADVNAEVDTALQDIHLDHLLAADYDPANKPGVATALFNELIENDGGVSRFTANALEQAPAGGGGGGGGDATLANQTAILAQLDLIQAGTDLLAEDVTINVVTGLIGSTLTIGRGVSLSQAIPGIGTLVGRSKLWFTLKRRKQDADSAAIVQIEESGGLLYLNGAAPGSGQTGSITVTDAAAGNVTIALSAAAAAALPYPISEMVWDIKVKIGANVIKRVEGAAHLDADVTRAVA